MAIAHSKDFIMVIAHSKDFIMAIAHSKDFIMAIARNKDFIMAIARSKDFMMAIARSTDFIMAIARSTDFIMAIARSTDFIMAIAHIGERQLMKRCRLRKLTQESPSIKIALNVTLSVLSFTKAPEMVQICVYMAKGRKHLFSNFLYSIDLTIFLILVYNLISPRLCCLLIFSAGK